MRALERPDHILRAAAHACAARGPRRVNVRSAGWRCAASARACLKAADVADDGRGQLAGALDGPDVKDDRLCAHSLELFDDVAAEKARAADDDALFALVAARPLACARRLCRARVSGTPQRSARAAQRALRERPDGIALADMAISKHQAIQWRGVTCVAAMMVQRACRPWLLRGAVHTHMHTHLSALYASYTDPNSSIHFS